MSWQIALIGIGGVAVMVIAAILLRSRLHVSVTQGPVRASVGVAPDRDGDVDLRDVRAGQDIKVDARQIRGRRFTATRDVTLKANPSRALDDPKDQTPSGSA